VLVARRVGAIWCYESELVLDERQADAAFGSAVSIDGDTAVVGAPGASAGAGRVFVFQRASDGWRLTARLAAESTSSAAFGSSVAIWGDDLLVGAPNEARGAGAGYAFRRRGDAWELSQRLAVDGLRAKARFGFAVSIFDATAVVGAPGTQGDTGAAYAFERASGWAVVDSWVGDFGSQFGYSVSVEQDDMVIGAPASGLPNGTNPVPLIDDMGSAYALHRDPGGWSAPRQMSVGLLFLGDNLGFIGASVSVAGGTIVVGAPGDDNGRGLARVFRRSEYGPWCQVAALGAEQPVRYANVGGSVSVAGTSVWVGTREPGAGAAYAFSLRDMPASDLPHCSGVPPF
jgi:hypothetical protein